MPKSGPLHPRRPASHPRAKRRGHSALSGRPRRAALGALIEMSDEGMILADQGGIIVYANAACEELLGYRPDEVVGRSLFDLCLPEHVPLARGAVARCLETSDIVTCDLDVLDSRGDVRAVSLKLLNRLEAAGINAVLVTAQASRASGEGQEQEAYRGLFENAPIGLGVADLKGNLLVFNDAILRPGGYTRDDLLGLGNLSALYANPEDRERVLRVSREHGVVRREAVQFVGKDGSPYDTLLTLTPVRFRGQSCWYATVEDIADPRKAESERRELEVRLWQARKMEAVGNMTAGIAHDFNNILAVILANADLVASELGPEAEASQRDLAALRAAAMRGSEMIRRLLGYSRKAQLAIEPTDIAAVVNELHPTLRRMIPDDILLEMSLADRTTALCDRGAVEEMLLNLATNARDATPHGGTVRITIGSAVVAGDAPDRPPWMTPGRFVRLSVSDNGVGMDESTRARVLEPFFTTKARGSGTGLGLPMVYGLAKQQGGFIDVHSRPGSGTTVHLYFPPAA